MNDSELMMRYVRGDRSAFDTLFVRYREPLRRYFRAQGATQDAAKDLTQQTFLHLHRARNDFRSDHALRPWLYAIAKNVLRHELRRRRRKPEALVPDEALDRADPAEMLGSSRLDVARLLAQLPPPQRDVLILYWIQGLSFAEVGTTLGIRETAARVRAHRAYAALRKLLENEHELGNTVPQAGIVTDG
ncbi:MAG: RNA polymerase sigma factor [Myxococcota bacterium]